MAMTPIQEKRLIELEEKQQELFRLLNGAASKNMLNRLYVLINRELEKLENKADENKGILERILELARKVQ